MPSTKVVRVDVGRVAVEPVTEVNRDHPCPFAESAFGVRELPIESMLKVAGFDR